jgi:hypothetical protein
VRFVPRSQLNVARRIEPVDRAAYIGLTSKSEHVAGCRYAATAKLRTIFAAESDCNFLAALAHGRRQLRLLALHEGLAGSFVSSPFDRDVTNPPPIPQTKHPKQVLPNGEKLSSYLRTTADIVALRAACESNEVLASELELTWAGQRIGWDQFYFDRERYDEAWHRVTSIGESQHPIAIEARVSGVWLPDKAGSSGYLNCAPLFLTTDDPNLRHAFDVSIAHRDTEWLSSFTKGSVLVLFGLWSHEKPAARKSTKSTHLNILFHKLILRPKFKRQVVLVSSK